MVKLVIFLINSNAYIAPEPSHVCNGIIKDINLPKYLSLLHARINPPFLKSIYTSPQKSQHFSLFFYCSVGIEYQLYFNNNNNIACCRLKINLTLLENLFLKDYSRRKSSRKRGRWK